MHPITFPLLSSEFENASLPQLDPLHFIPSNNLSFILIFYMNHCDFYKLYILSAASEEDFSSSTGTVVTNPSATTFNLIDEDLRKDVTKLADQFERMSNYF